MTDSYYSGNVHIDNTSSETQVNKPIGQIVVENQKIEDPRICMVREYISISPNSTLKDIRSKALLNFSKATEEELKEIIKSANIEKYNEFYTNNNISSQITSKLSQDEIQFLEQHKNNYNRAEIYEKYKSLFPTSTRKMRFITDYYYKCRTTQSTINQISEHVPHSPTVKNHHILAKAITALYKSGKSPKIFCEIKPIIELINDPQEVDFAIECLIS